MSNLLFIFLFLFFSILGSACQKVSKEKFKNSSRPLSIVQDQRSQEETAAVQTETTAVVESGAVIDVGTASEVLDQASEAIQIESETLPLSDLTWRAPFGSSISSRFNCTTVKKAASVAHEVYPITMREDSFEEFSRGRRSEDFEIFYARTGGKNEPLSPRGFLEYVPSELETLLESTSEDVALDFASLSTHREVLLVFRGTIGELSGPDWLTNRDMKAASARSLHPDATGVIHRGFLNAYRSAQDHLREYFNSTFIEKSKRFEERLRARLYRSGVYTQDSIDRYIAAALGNYQVLITGHSLGGALATLAAYDFALQFESSREKLSLVTFAAPASLYGVKAGESLHQFSHLMARGTPLGNRYSAVFFEREGDIVHEDTARENYGFYAPLGRFFYHGNAAPFEGRPENSGLRVRMDPISHSGFFDRAADALLRALTGNMIHSNFLAAHSMEGYKNDIEQYCDEMDDRQKCLRFDDLSDFEKARCLVLGMDSDQSSRYLREIQDEGKIHIMDHRDFEQIRHQD